MKSFICLALVIMIAISMSQSKTHPSSRGLSPLGYHQDNPYQTPILTPHHSNWGMRLSSKLAHHLNDHLDDNRAHHPSNSLLETVPDHHGKFVQEFHQKDHQGKYVPEFPQQNDHQGKFMQEFHQKDHHGKFVQEFHQKDHQGRYVPQFPQNYDPFVIPEEYPQKINLKPTPEQYAQVIEGYTPKVVSGEKPNESVDDQKSALNFYLLVSALMKYLTDVQHLLQQVSVIQTKHAPINAAFEMIQQLELTYENMIRYLNEIKFDKLTYKTHPESSIVTEYILKMMSQIYQNQGGFKGSDGILESYQMNNYDTRDYKTKFVIDKLRSILQSGSTINSKAMDLIRESLFYLKMSKNNFKSAKNGITFYNSHYMRNPILSDETYAKIIDTQTALLSQVKPSESRIDTESKLITFENNLATAVKMLDDLHRVLRFDIKSNLAPYIAGIKLINQASYIIEGGIGNMTSCQMIAREDMAKSENSNYQLDNGQQNYVSYLRDCKFILANTREQLLRIRTEMGKSGVLLSSYRIYNIHHDDYNSLDAVNELIGYMLVPQLIISRVQNLIDESLALIDH